MKVKDPADILDFAKLLEEVAPGKPMAVENMVEYANKSRSNISRKVDTLLAYQLRIPEISIYCPSTICLRRQVFRKTISNPSINADENQYFFLQYICSNCRSSEKTFAILAKFTNPSNAYCLKLGELPPFGDPTPNRLLNLFGDDKELFLNGRRCEYQNLGIGAFTYYRRVLQNRKESLLSEIIKVGIKSKISKDKIEKLEKAKSEREFTRAIKEAEDVLPPSLMMDGHNPLSLLYTALSDGLHVRSDEECLTRAKTIRLILVSLTEQISVMLKNDDELRNALTVIMSKNGSKTE